ncbi:MAG: ribosome recycling factor [Planctomycetaceae bacterium]|nr:ribosome recycling factor [Planctomycetaceae bacterium]
MDQDEILLDTEERMEKAAEVLHGQLQGIRTGRATPGLVDSIRVDYYGSQTPIKQMASVTVQEGKQIVIRPFDATAVSNIVKAIQTSEVGLTPNSDGRLIRVNVPPLSTERRRQLASRVKELAEEARVAIRNVRRDGNKHADTLQKDKGCTEDERDQLKEQVQNLTKTYEGKVNAFAESKEKEIMED